MESEIQTLKEEFKGNIRTMEKGNMRVQEKIERLYCGGNIQYVTRVASS